MACSRLDTFTTWDDYTYPVVLDFLTQDTSDLRHILGKWNDDMQVFRLYAQS